MHIDPLWPGCGTGPQPNGVGSTVSRATIQVELTSPQRRRLPTTRTRFWCACPMATYSATFRLSESSTTSAGQRAGDAPNVPRPPPSSSAWARWPKRRRIPPATTSANNQSQGKRASAVGLTMPTPMYTTLGGAAWFRTGRDLTVARAGRCPPRQMRTFGLRVAAAPPADGAKASSLRLFTGR
jgi:hypothetical protein